MKQDELVGMLGSQPDFSESKPKLQDDDRVMLQVLQNVSKVFHKIIIFDHMLYSACHKW